MKILKKAKQAMTVQSYQKPPAIDGVKVVEIKRFVGEDGAFSEIVRLKQGKIVFFEQLKGFEIRQINHSRVLPGTIKAWHLHYQQDEVWFIHPYGQLIVGLLDVRQESATEKLSMRLSLGGGKAHLLYIPRGVAHGLANPYHQAATMTYLVNNYFTGKDEKRLPADFGVEKDFWQIRKG